MKPFVFIDFDGVLNTPAIWGKRPAVEALDPVLVKRFSDFCERVDAQVIVSSSWRIIYDLGQLREFLKGAGFENPERIISITPKAEGNVVRGKEIVDWVWDRITEERKAGEAKVRSSKIPALVIFDDMGPAQFPGLLEWLVHVNGAHGLQESDVRKAEDILHAFTLREG